MIHFRRYHGAEAKKVSFFFCAIYRDVAKATRKETIILKKDTRQR
jgi:hypothetical protein